MATDLLASQVDIGEVGVHRGRLCNLLASDMSSEAAVSEQPESNESAQTVAVPALPNADAVKQAEKAAVNVHKKISNQAAPIRQYLEGTVVPLLMQGLQALCKERPDNPVEYLAMYLLKHNPQPATATSVTPKPDQ